MKKKKIEKKRAAPILSRANRITGEKVELYDADKPDNNFDAAGGRWVTRCTAHNTRSHHRTKKLALSDMAAPAWCELCQQRVQELVNSI